MNELLKIDVNDNQEQVISGRDLHMFLEIGTAYKDWFPRMCEYGFIEGTDFCSKMSLSTGGRPSTDHSMKLEMAKQLCMLARNEKGMQARKYFLSVEKDWNSPEKVIARGLMFAEKQIHQLTAIIEENKPKILFADSVTASNKSMLIGELAKIIKQNGYEVGQKRLFQWLRENNYLCKIGESYNLPSQYAMERKLFEIKKSTVNAPNGNVIVTNTVKVTPKGQMYFINKFLGEKRA